MKNWLLVPRALIVVGLLLAMQNGVQAAPGGRKPPPDSGGTGVCQTGDPKTRIDCFGVSGGTRKYLDINGTLYFYAGTIGALLEDSSGERYLLSNNHVFAQENGNGGKVTAGDEIIQPGTLEWYYDSSLKGQSVTVGKVTGWVPIEYGSTGHNLVDAAIAEVYPSDSLDSQGRILGIGPINAEVMSPSVGQPVHKAGRTTGHTWGLVSAIHVDGLKVSYDGGTATFDDQIYVANQGSCGSFSDSGDSGSLILSGPDSGNKDLSSPVALLFAGGNTGTFGNPIGAVLSGLNTGLNLNLSLSFASCAPAADCTVYAKTVDACLGGGGGGGKKNRPRGAQHMSDVALARLQAIKARNQGNLSALDAVTGVGITQDDAGEGALAVFVKSREEAKGIPAYIEGVPVKLIETGVIRAY
jgi:hypothetical protein